MQFDDEEARAKLESASALNKAQADLALAKTQFEAARRELRLHLIRTPNGGTVSEIRVKVGDRVKSVA